MDAVAEIREAITRHQRLLAVSGGDPELIYSETAHVVIETLDGVDLSLLSPDSSDLLMRRIEALVIGPLLVALKLATTLEQLHGVARAAWQHDVDIELEESLRDMGRPPG